MRNKERVIEALRLRRSGYSLKEIGWQLGGDKPFSRQRAFQLVEKGKAIEAEEEQCKKNL